MLLSDPQARSGPAAPNVAEPRGLSWLPLLIVQAVFGLRVLARLARTARGQRIEPVDRLPAADGSVSVLLPVLNEQGRLGPCLDGLLAQGPELHEVLVLDGGSEDGTQALVAAYQEC